MFRINISYADMCVFVSVDELSKLMSDIPTLDAIMKEIDQMATSGAKYSDAPHVIEVTLPMLCR